MSKKTNEKKHLKKFIQDMNLKEGYFTSKSKKQKKPSSSFRDELLENTKKFISKKGKDLS